MVLVLICWNWRGVVAVLSNLGPKNSSRFRVKAPISSVTTNRTALLIIHVQICTLCMLIPTLIFTPLNSASRTTTSCSGSRCPKTKRPSFTMVARNSTTVNLQCSTIMADDLHQLIALVLGVCTIGYSLEISRLSVDLAALDYFT